MLGYQLIITAALTGSTCGWPANPTGGNNDPTPNQHSNNVVRVTDTTQCCAPQHFAGPHVEDVEVARLLPTGEVLFCVAPIQPHITHDMIHQEAANMHRLMAWAVEEVGTGRWFVPDALMDQAVRFATARGLLLEESAVSREAETADAHDWHQQHSFRGHEANNSHNLEGNQLQDAQNVVPQRPDLSQWKQLDISPGVVNAWSLFRDAVEAIGGIIDGDGTFETAKHWWLPKTTPANIASAAMSTENIAHSQGSKMPRYTEGGMESRTDQPSASGQGSHDMFHFQPYDGGMKAPLVAAGANAVYPAITLGQHGQILVQDAPIPYSLEDITSAAHSMVQFVDHVGKDPKDGHYYVPGEDGANDPLEVVYFDHPKEAVGPTYEWIPALDRDGGNGLGKKCSDARRCNHSGHDELR